MDDLEQRREPLDPQPEWIPGPLTWGQLKAAIEQRGVTDTDVIRSVRFGPHVKYLGFRRTPDGIELVQQGSLWSPQAPREDKG